jgi:hypothetical protein
MANIVVIENDPKIIREISSYLKEMDETNAVRFFDSAEVFEELYFAPKVEDENEEEKAPPPAEEENDEEEGKYLGTIDLIIIKTQCCEEDVREWIQRVYILLKKNNFWPEENSTRFIITKYEDEEMDKIKLTHPLIEDLILLPLDRMIFMQKVEIALNLPEGTSPQYLFNQPAEMSVEIAKRSQAEKLSEFGLAIRNPVALSPGLLAHFYFKPPGQDQMIDAFAKVLFSTKHPKKEKMFLVYFNFFGIKKEMLLETRKYLNNKVAPSSYNALKKEDPKLFKLDLEDPFVKEEDKRVKNIVLLDADPTIRESIQSSINESIDNIKITSESSYYIFMKKYLDPSKSSDAAVPITEKELTQPISWCVEEESQELVALHTTIGENLPFLGYTIGELFKPAQAWRDLFKNEESQAILDEMFTVVYSGQSISNPIALNNKEEGFTLVQLTMSPSFNKRNAIDMEINLTDPNAPRAESLNSLDLLVIDQSLLPPELDSWVEGFKEKLMIKRFIRDNKLPPVIILNSKEPDEGIERFKESSAFQLIHKPLDMRSLIYSIASSLNIPFTKYKFKNINWIDVSFKANIAKEIQLEELSEFGVTLRSNNALAPGTTLFLFGHFFDSAPDRNMCARVYFSTGNPNMENTYLCYLIYYGINDQFLKYTRNWIREHYASKKQSSG